LSSRASFALPSTAPPLEVAAAAAAAAYAMLRCLAVLGLLAAAAAQGAWPRTLTQRAPLAQQPPRIAARADADAGERGAHVPQCVPDTLSLPATRVAEKQKLFETTVKVDTTDIPVAVYEGDSPADVATAFAQTHKLDQDGAMAVFYHLKQASASSALCLAASSCRRLTPLLCGKIPRS
jgi:hypothetical protein